MLYNTRVIHAIQKTYIIQISRRFLFETAIRVLRIFVLLLFVFSRNRVCVYYQSLTPGSDIHTSRIPVSSMTIISRYRRRPLIADERARGFTTHDLRLFSFFFFNYAASVAHESQS